jgi:hypothetical protein
LLGLYVGIDADALTCHFLGSNTTTATESAFRFSKYFFAIASISFWIQMSIVKTTSSQSFVLITSKSLHHMFRLERHVISQSTHSKILS